MYLIDLPAPALVAIAGLFGALVGSFLNVVIFRLPRMLNERWDTECQAHLNPDEQIRANTQTFNLAIPDSHCPICNHRIRPWENIPILSWLFLRGRCSSCDTRISARYPLVEALTSLLSALVVWHFGPSPEAFGALILTWTLIALTFIDIDHQLLPDDITQPLLWAGLLFSLVGGLTSLQDAVIGAIAGYLSLWLIFHGFRLLTGKEGMGFGDFKLLAALGAWLGWQALPMIALLGSSIGSVLAVIALRSGLLKSGAPIPFGPFLALGGWISLMWGESILNWYLSVSGLNA